MDDAAIASFRGGDPEAIRTLYQEFARPIATVARAVVGNDQSLIDDVVQQTFTKAWRAAHTFDESRSLAPWLYSIARRTAIDAVRAERRPTRGDHEPEVDIAVPPASLEKTWEAYEIRRAVEALPDEEREVVQLGHMLGLTHREIADRIGVPLGTVKSRSHRAHRRLAAALAHLADPGEPPDPGPAAQAPAPEGEQGPTTVALSRELR